MVCIDDPRVNPNYTVILMSQRKNTPYNDRVSEDGLTIESRRMHAQMNFNVDSRHKS